MAIIQESIRQWHFQSSNTKLWIYQAMYLLFTITENILLNTTKSTTIWTILSIKNSSNRHSSFVYVSALVSFIVWSEIRRVFENKVSRTIHGDIYNMRKAEELIITNYNELHKIIYELYEIITNYTRGTNLYGKPNLVWILKLNTLRSSGYVYRMG